jgi:hypothetical protein
MWCKFWFGTESQAKEQTEAYGAEVMNAGWMPLVAETASSPHDPAPANDQPGEAAAFLARVYTNQRC